MFTQGELNNLLALLLRVNITGNESEAVTLLQYKIRNLLKAETPIEEPKSETPTSE